MENEKELLPIGTKVFDVRFGWGEVIKHYNSKYPINCDFHKTMDVYTPEGFSNIEHKSPLLSLTEYSLTEGGFTSITEFDLDAPKVGDWGYFWDDEKPFIIYGQLVTLRTGDVTFGTPVCAYKNFSKEIPNHIKELQEKE